MNHEELLMQLEDLADRLDIQIHYESLKSEDPSTFGGFCRVQDRHMIIIHSRATVSRKVDIFTEALRHFDMDDLFMRPALREYLKKKIASADGQS
jgi:hypothetical protein